MPMPLPTTRRRLLHHATALGLGAMLPLHGARAAAYPDKTVRIVIPYPAGGATDNLGRLSGQTLQAALG
ncbi:hypothetical protein [Pseudorhodoferax sp. Leaf274]|uniref:hypothetical protein n=1 Tax=Pseudorhodoferax sp. Leaf274 TaxID=1736318 RepID=UPI001F272A1C|nr:hypothetical protein [Pseudorhodoferax sp. Leaf274]